MLNKLYVPDVVDDYRIRSLKLLMDNLRAVSRSTHHILIEIEIVMKQRRPLRDSACNTAFTKFETAMSKKFEKQLQDFTEEEFRTLEELTELFAFLDSIIPLDDDENQAIDAPRRSNRKRFFFPYYSDDWVLIEELDDRKACLALALRQKPIMVPLLRRKRKGD